MLGNHSFYKGGNVDRIRGRWKQYMDENPDNGVYYLDEGFNYTFEGVNFVGGIFWTDFNDYNEQDMNLARHMMNDYHGCCMSKMDSGLDNTPIFDYATMQDSDEYQFTPRRSVDEHYKTKEYMNHMLSEWKGQKNVVVTHHLPSGMSTDSRFRGNDLNPAYHSHLEEWIMDRDINLWVHGHTHGNNDYYIDEVDAPENGRTRIVCNPRGYYMYDPNYAFIEDLVVEV